MNKYSYSVLVWFFSLCIIIFIVKCEGEESQNVPSTSEDVVDDDIFVMTTQKTIDDSLPSSSEDVRPSAVITEAFNIVDGSTSDTPTVMPKTAAEERNEVSSVESKPTNILIFGGNGLLGVATVQKLLKLPNGANIYLVNRGNWYWDSASVVKPFVTEIFHCDRSLPLKDCSSLYDFVTDRSNFFHFVVDFSALESSVLDDTLGVLRRTHVGLYIYISSDSVYEVCVKEDPPSPSRETDDRRPIEVDSQQRLNNLDPYGDGKLACEESLARSRAAGGPPYVVLRLPDVIGPRDSTLRFWMTHILLNLHTFLMQPLKIPNDQYLMSFVYSEDVASLIYTMINSDDTLNWADEAFNVAWPEPVTFENLYTTILSFLSIGKPFKLEHPEGEEEIKTNFYPSVTRGPVNVTKLTSFARWIPTDWRKAIGETVEFYKEASNKYPENFKKALRGLNGKLDDETLKKASFGVYAVELSSGGCIDLHPKCGQWATAGECQLNPRWMKPNCMESCDTCHLLEKARTKKDEL